MINIEAKLSHGNIVGYDLMRYELDAAISEYKDVIIDSAEAHSWVDITDCSAYETANEGTIVAATLATGIISVYELPKDKRKHRVSVYATDQDVNDFEFTMQIFEADQLPAATPPTLANFMAMSYLSVPGYKLARDPSKMIISQPIIETNAAYLVFHCFSVATQPDKNVLIRVRSYNDGDV